MVELVALLPVLVLLAAVGWQIAVAGHAWALANGAVRAGERAAEVGAPAAEAARAALPARYAAGAVVFGTEGGRGLRVRLLVPQVLPWMPRPEYVSAGAGAGR